MVGHNLNATKHHNWALAKKPSANSVPSWKIAGFLEAQARLQFEEGEEERGAALTIDTPAMCTR